MSPWPGLQGEGVTLPQQWKGPWVIWDLLQFWLLLMVLTPGLCTSVLPQAPFSSPLFPPLHRAGTAPDQALQELSPIRNKSIFEQPSQFGVSGFCRTLSEEFRGIFERRCADDSPQILITPNLWGESSTPGMSRAGEPGKSPPALVCDPSVAQGQEGWGTSSSMLLVMVARAGNPQTEGTAMHHPINPSGSFH